MLANWRITKYFNVSAVPLIKSDRINTLKKRYDAFLEDDKKRKERNEYILEKLDKMRYCTAIVPVRLKPSTFNDVNLYNRPAQAFDSPTELTHNDQRYMHLDLPRKHTDEIVLQEISKKYILIPKLRPVHDKDSTLILKPKIDENSDWKSKYDILDKLKKDEKEQDSPTHPEISLFETEKGVVGKKYIEENVTTRDDEPLLEYRKEIPEKLPREEQIPYDLNNYAKGNDETERNYHYAHQKDKSFEKANLEQNNNENDNNEQNNVYNTCYYQNDVQSTVYDGNNIQDTSYDHNNIKNTGYDQNNLENTVHDQIPTNEKTECLDTQESNLNDYEYNQNVEPVNLQQQYPQDTTHIEKHDEYFIDPELNNEVQETPADNPVHEQLITEEDNNDKSRTYLDQGEISPVVGVNASDMINEINNEVPLEQDSSFTDTNLEYPIDPVNVQEFTPHDSVQLTDGVNVNPKPLVLADNNDLTDHYDPVVQTGDANAPEEMYNTEQSEGLYNEQTENYDYTEEAVAENYNPEYAPNETYQQNEEYGYYEGAQTEQPYTEVNESEETTQRYDQNYEQQYGTAYDQQGYPQQGYEQEYAQGYEQQGYVEPQQHYEGVDQTQQDVEQVQLENQDMTPQYVEQQLDNEQGYVNEPNVETEISKAGKLENVQPVPSAVEQQSKVQ